MTASSLCLTSHHTPLAVSGGVQGDLMSAHWLNSLQLKETQHRLSFASRNGTLEFYFIFFLFPPVFFYPAAVEQNHAK